MSTLKGVGLSLYDYLGFLLPGVVFLAAIAIFGWSLWAADYVFVRPDFSTEVWIALLVVGYFCGHAAQAIANVVDAISGFISARVGRDRWAIEEKQLRRRLSGDGASTEILDAAAARAAAMLGVSPNRVNLKLLAKLGEELAEPDGRTRLEMYSYREGFYRGGVIALGTLAIAVLVRAVVGEVEVAAKPPEGFRPHPVTLPGWGLVGLAGLLAVTAVLWWRRYTRFSIGADARAILSFLALHTRAEQAAGPPRAEA